VFDRTVIVIFENELDTAVLNDPYLGSQLKGQGTYLAHSYGVTHPSQPNYIAAIAGDTHGVWDDNVHTIDAISIVDLLEAKNISWKAYMEDLPHDKLIPQSGLYYRKHNPFVSFSNIQTNPNRLARIVEAGHLQQDVANNALPQYCWFTPNIQNDGHSPPHGGAHAGHHTVAVRYLSQWLQGFLTPLLQQPHFSNGTLVVVTFDESIPYADNHIYTLLLGDMVQKDAVETATYNHYSLLRTIEVNWELGDLGRHDALSNYYDFLWGRGHVRPFDVTRHG
jgi:phospholipase C